MKKNLKTSLGEIEYSIKASLKDITYDKEIKENGDFIVSFHIPDEIFDSYQEDEIIEYLCNQMNKILEV